MQTKSYQELFQEKFRTFSETRRDLQAWQCRLELKRLQPGLFQAVFGRDKRERLMGAIDFHLAEGYAVAEDKGVVVAVDVVLTPELAREGLARDLVRRVQTLRKDAGFQLDDRILTFYEAEEELNAVFAEWAEYIRSETLSMDLVPGPLPGDVSQSESFKLGGHLIYLGLKKA